MDNKYYIVLGVDTYEVKTEGVKYMVCFGGTWLSQSAFVDMLVHIGAWDQIADLARAAFLLKPEEANAIVNHVLANPGYEPRDCGEKLKP